MKKRRNIPHKRHNNLKNLPGPDDEYIKDLETWMDNRYNPGFYTGGQIPPYIKYPKKPLGYVFLVSGCISLVAAYVMRISGSDTASVLFPFLYSLVVLVAGFFIVTKGKEK